jgi:ankyrin repeat protein
MRGCFPPALRRALEELPKSLDTTYERILLGIENAKREYANRLLLCLVVSIRPLRVEELAEVLAIRVYYGEDSEYQSDWRPEDARHAVFSACSSLVTIVNVDGSPVVQFSHFSVKEFLMSSRLANAGEHLSFYHIDSHSAHVFISQVSLSILLSFGDDVDKRAVEQRPFANYTARYWVDHAKVEGVSSSIQDLMERLFDPDRPYFATWVWIYDIDRPWRGSMPTMRPTQPEAKPLYYAALCGFRGLMEHLLIFHQIDVNARGGDHGTALSASLAKGELDIARALLQDGADVNTLDHGGDSPLNRAAETGHQDAVELLLEHQADINLQAGFRRLAPLHLAAWFGEYDILRILLKHGADVTPKMRDGWTALLLASHFGHFSMVQELLFHGADVDGQKEDLWTSLHLASAGDLDIVQMLVQHGATLDSRTVDEQTPLHVASYSGNLEISRFLISNGADTMSED